MFSIGQSVLSHKHRYGNRKIQAQFEATYKIVKKKKKQTLSAPDTGKHIVVKLSKI